MQRTGAWGVACRRLPLALSAKLVVAETVFCLAYGFMFQARLPSPVQAIGAALQFVGVSSAIAVFSKPRSTTMATQILERIHPIGAPNAV
jgi:hypothetical protein